MSRRHLISDHAVVRWLERIDGVDVEAVRRQLPEWAGDTAVLGVVAGDLGIDVENVRRRMATPAVRQAVGCGAAAVRVGAARLVLDGGVVVTVKVAGWRLCRAGRGPPFGRPRPRRETGRAEIDAHFSGA